MKTITLKLTKSEHRLLQNLNSHPFARSNKLEGLVNLNIVQVGADVLNVDKFREFLNDEIDKCFPTTKKMELEFSEMLSYPSGAFYEGSESQKLDNLKSILSKLDKEVK